MRFVVDVDARITFAVPPFAREMHLVLTLLEDYFERTMHVLKGTREQQKERRSSRNQIVRRRLINSFPRQYMNLQLRDRVIFMFRYVPNGVPKDSKIRRRRASHAVVLDRKPASSSAGFFLGGRSRSRHSDLTISHSRLLITTFSLPSILL